MRSKLDDFAVWATCWLNVRCWFGLEGVGLRSWGCSRHAQWWEVCGNYCVQHCNLSTLLLDIYWTFIPPAGLMAMMHFMCVCVLAHMRVCGKCMHSVLKVLHMVCTTTFKALGHLPLWCLIVQVLSLSLSLLYFLMVYIRCTDSVYLFELFTFFSDWVICWIYKYSSVCLYVVCMLDSKHSPCNDVQSLRCISCACLQRGWILFIRKKVLFRISCLHTFQISKDSNICLADIAGMGLKCTCYEMS